MKKPDSIKQLALGMAAYSSASIFGPLVIFILLGLFLDKKFSSNPFFLLGGVALAFVVTNILLYKKVKILIQKFNKLDQDKKSVSAEKKTEDGL